MKTFYREMMGFQIYRDDGEWVEMKIGALLLLALRKRGAHTMARNLRILPAFNSPFEWHRTKWKHVEILDPPRDMDYGHRTLFFRDPEDNILEIYADI